MFKSHSGDGWTKSFLGQWLWIIGTRFIREDAWYKLHKYTLFFFFGGGSGFGAYVVDFLQAMVSKCFTGK